MGLPDWFPFQFTPSPYTGYVEKTPNVEHLPITTRKGRVVYNRKTHRFNQNDLARIAGEVLGVQGDRKQGPFWILLMEQITIWMMQVIQEKFLTGKLKQIDMESLYYLFRDNLAIVLDNLPADIRKQADEYLAQTYGI